MLVLSDLLGSKESQGVKDPKVKKDLLAVFRCRSVYHGEIATKSRKTSHMEDKEEEKVEAVQEAFT